MEKKRLAQSIRGEMAFTSFPMVIGALDGLNTSTATTYRSSPHVPKDRL